MNNVLIPLKAIHTDSVPTTTSKRTEVVTNMSNIIKVVLVLCLTSVSKQIEAQKASKNSSNWCRSKTKALFFLDPLECPRDTIAYGMTVSIPELDYWRDPKFGPPPANNAPMPLSVCLLCHTITTILGNREDGENVETLQENQPSYQVCIGKGQKDMIASLILHFQKH